MRTKIATAALIGGLGLTGGLLVAPGLATADDTGTTTSAATSTGVGGRLAALKDALKGLVTDKTLTQAQADKVAATLDARLPRRGPGRPGGPGLLARAAVAKALGLTESELHTQLEAGKTLAQIAQAKSISKATLIADLIKAAEAQLDLAVKEGRLTQAEADAKKATLSARITARVDEVGHGPRGGRHHRGPAPTDTAPTDPSTADASPSSTA